MAPNQLVLPTGVVTSTDLGRLIRELDNLDDIMQQAGLRTGGTAVNLPKLTRLMDEVCSLNKLNLLHQEDRTKLSKLLVRLKQSAPVLTISFNADPSNLFLQKLITWLRQEMHPEMLLRVGLQPNIGAGCVVRTNNKFFDFSLKSLMDKQRELLVSSLTQTTKEPS